MEMNNTGNDVWSKEGELQRIYGMTLNEAHVYNLIEAEKKTAKDIAEAEGMSQSTVKTYLARARRKVESNVAEKKMKMFVIPKLSPSDQGRAYKTPVIMKIGYFLAKVHGAEFHIGNLTYMIRLPADTPGDLAWYKTNVAGKIKNLVGGTEGPAKCEEIGGQMADIVFESGETNKIGWGILKYHLDQMYIKCDVYED